MKSIKFIYIVLILSLAISASASDRDVDESYFSDDNGRYLIIVHDMFYQQILPLAEWKHTKGMEVEIAKISEIGSLASQIKAYITDAYNTWDIPPEYVLLVGDTEFVAFGSDYSDNYYADMTADIKAELFVGRFSCDSVDDCELLVAKNMGYEFPEMDENPEWFISSTLIVRNDYDEADTTYYNDTWFAYNLMQSEGFTVIDTFFAENGADEEDVEQAVTNGRTIVNYRGQGVSNWWTPFGVDPDEMENGFMLPVVMSATCGTGDFDGDGYICEDWVRSGTPDNPQGSVAFFGTYTVGSHVENIRSAVDRGFFRSIFQSNQKILGKACVDAKDWLLHVYPNQQNEYKGWNLLGDPELHLWTAVPPEMEVVLPDTVPMGESDVEISVSDGEDAIKGALVSLLKGTEVYTYDYTDSEGNVTLSVAPEEFGYIYVTVTHTNFLAFQDSIMVQPEEPYVLYHSHTIQDTIYGNGDEYLNPGEIADMYMTLRNYGEQPAVDVTATLHTETDGITLQDSVVEYGDIQGYSIQESSEPFRFSVDENIGLNAPIHFQLSVTDSAGNMWESALPVIHIEAGDLVINELIIDDSAPGGNDDGELDAGETANLIYALENIGSSALSEVVATLSSQNPHILIQQSESIYGSIDGGAMEDNQGNPFIVTINPELPSGYEIDVQLDISGDGGSYDYDKSLESTLLIGEKDTSSPSGADSYGYWAYDNTDSLFGHSPTFQWTEIATGLGDSLDVGNHDAWTETVDLPFDFQYYGNVFDEFSVNSNGFLALGVDDYTNGDNSSIPNPHGPANMIAPFWDDLDPSDGGDMFKWYDSENHRFIVEWHECIHYDDFDNKETFQVILYDPAHYPTPTGDGEIVLLYDRVDFPTECTVGIENQAQNIGIQYLYDGNYDAQAAPLTAGRAIKFTTYSPEPAPVPWLLYESYEIDDTTYGDGDGRFEYGERVDLMVSLINSGTGAADDVLGVINCENQNLTIVESEAEFDDIPEGGIGDNSESPFDIQAAEQIQDSVFIFDLSLSTADGYQTDVNFSVAVYAPSTSAENSAINVPKQFAIHQNYPNPFNPTTTIQYELPKKSDVTITIYDILGRCVKTLVDKSQDAGYYSIKWFGNDNQNKDVPSGVYVYSIQTEKYTDTMKMILLR